MHYSFQPFLLICSLAFLALSSTPFLLFLCLSGWLYPTTLILQGTLKAVFLTVREYVKAARSENNNRNLGHTRVDLIFKETRDGLMKVLMHGFTVGKCVTVCSKLDQSYQHNLLDFSLCIGSSVS